MLRSVKVQDYMTKKLITFKPETDLFEAIRVFTEHNISGAPVVNDREELVGMLSEVDCLKNILTYTYHEEEMGGVVGDFMSTEVRTINADSSIVELSELFINENLRRLPVLKDNHLVGQISRKDVLRAVKEFVTKD